MSRTLNDDFDEDDLPGGSIDLEKGSHVATAGVASLSCIELAHDFLRSLTFVGITDEKTFSALQFVERIGDLGGSYRRRVTDARLRNLDALVDLVKFHISLIIQHNHLNANRCRRADRFNDRATQAAGRHRSLDTDASES